MCEGRHYVTIFMQAFVVDQNKEPVVMEPEKCEGWEWTPWATLGRTPLKMQEGTAGNGWEKEVQDIRGKTRSASAAATCGTKAAVGPVAKLFQPLAELKATNFNPFG
ncbi:unnamed protein product [Discosporangium mesarthrocarpum]